MTPIKPRNRLQLTQTVSKRFNVLKCAPFQARRTMLQPLQRARQIRYANAKPVNVAPRALKRPQSLQRPLATGELCAFTHCATASTLCPQYGLIPGPTNSPGAEIPPATDFPAPPARAKRAAKRAPEDVLSRDFIDPDNFAGGCSAYYSNV
jgi:hypothetical protein